MQYPRTPTIDMIPFSPKQDVEPKPPNRKLQNTCDSFTSIHVRAPLSINLDEEIGGNVIHDGNTNPNASDSDYKYIDVDKHLSSEFSKALILAPRIEQSDLAHENSPYLDLVMAPAVVLNVSPLACCPPS